jgi:hypothetical protein
MQSILVLRCRLVCTLWSFPTCPFRVNVRVADSIMWISYRMALDLLGMGHIPATVLSRSYRNLVRSKEPLSPSANGIGAIHFRAPDCCPMADRASRSTVNAG